MSVSICESRQLVGSPPRVRGHVTSNHLSLPAPRITPAGAGTCGTIFTTIRHLRDHPRGCGDMRKNQKDSNRLRGSPPRVRGHVGNNRFYHLSDGITPAGAGTCVSGSWFKACTKDHPRGCGDMHFSFSALSATSGSPPRVRGHENIVLTETGNHRITPAGAGTCLSRVAYWTQ